MYLVFVRWHEVWDAVQTCVSTLLLPHITVNCLHFCRRMELYTDYSLSELRTETYSLILAGCGPLSRWFLARLIRPWRWRRYVTPKRRLTLKGLQGVISQKTTALRASNPTARILIMQSYSVTKTCYGCLYDINPVGGHDESAAYPNPRYSEGVLCIGNLYRSPS
jgi:hypothetical protein